jgi:hypothetical protein
MVGAKEMAPYTGARRLLYKVVGVGAQMLSNLGLLKFDGTNMRPPRDLGMMIRNILNVNGVFYSK